MLEPAQRLDIHRQVFRRFFLIVWHAMPLVLLTGYAMIFGIYGGFAGLDWTINVMHLLGLIMAAIFIWIFIGPWKRLRDTASPAGPHLDSIRQLILINTALGLVTIVIAALGQFH